MSTPNGWDEALVAAGFIDRRSGKGPSWTALAEAIGKHPSTLTAMKEGTRRTDQATIDAVAEALHLDSRLIAKWAGRARSEREPYKPPSEANLLDKDERDVINRMIALLVRPRMEEVSDGRRPEAEKSDEQQSGRQEGGSDDGQSEAQKSPAGGGEVVEFPKQQKVIDQGQPVEEAAYDLPLNPEDGEENYSQDPGDWGDNPS